MVGSPHSYSRAEESARFVGGVRDDEMEKDYIYPEIALAANRAKNRESDFGSYSFV
jgi:hypothetical protein